MIFANFELSLSPVEVLNFSFKFASVTAKITSSFNIIFFVWEQSKSCLISSLRMLKIIFTCYRKWSACWTDCVMSQAWTMQARIQGRLTEKWNILYFVAHDVRFAPAQLILARRLTKHKGKWRIFLPHLQRISNVTSPWLPVYREQKREQRSTNVNKVGSPSWRYRWQAPLPWHLLLHKSLFDLEIMPMFRFNFILLD